MIAGRKDVSPSTEELLGPYQEPVTIEIISMSRVEANRAASMCWFEYSKEKCRPGEGIPLEPGTRIEIDLMPGQALWCVTQDVGLLAYSVKAFRGLWQ